MAMSLARSFERRNTTAVASQQLQAPPLALPRSRPLPLPILPTPPPPTSASSSQLPKVLVQSSSIATTVVAGRTVRRLTQPEIDEHRHLGLRFNCDERYVCGHNRSCKKLFYLDMDYDADDADDTEDLWVSLLVFTGIHTVHTTWVPSAALQLMVRVILVHLRALVDSGSSHNFINADRV